MIALCKSSDIKEVHEGMIGLRKLVSSSANNKVEQIAEGIYNDEGLFNTVIGLMRQNQYARLKAEAVWIITNIIASSFNGCKVISQAGIVQDLVSLIESNDVLVAEQAIWAVSNFAANSDIERA